jgi:hypothetical protein
MVVVYKINRLSGSLMYFAMLVQIFDQNEVTFVSVTQSFNTATSMGRIKLNILLSFEKFEREVFGERMRDKIEASRARGMWLGGRCHSAPLAARCACRAPRDRSDQRGGTSTTDWPDTCQTGALLGLKPRDARHERMRWHAIYGKH